MDGDNHPTDTPTISAVTIKNLIAGTIAGMAGVIAGHPLDTLKVHMQSSPNKHACKDKQCKKKRNPTIKQATLNIYKSGGLRAFWRGVESPLVGVGVINSALFGVFGWCVSVQKQYLPSDGADDANEELGRVCVAGAVSGAVNALFSTPIEQTKILQQLQANKGQDNNNSPLKSSWMCAKNVWRQGGWGLNGVWRGLGVTVLREVPSYAVYFGCFHYICTQYTPDNNHIGVLLVGGGVSGVLGWLSTYPLDTLKTRIQSSMPINKESTRTITQTYKQIIKESGHRGLWVGMNACILRAIPTNASILGVHALLMALLE